MDAQLRHAAQVLRAGGIVLHATEGVWGFACDPWSAHAVERVLALKGRAADKGLILIGARAADFEDQLSRLAPEHRAQVLASWPGHHTWVMPDSAYPALVTGGRATLACRVPGHAQARALCERFGGPLVSTSANAAGQPAITTVARARREFGERVDFLLPGRVGRAGRASIIHGLDGEILR